MTKHSEKLVLEKIDELKKHFRIVGEVSAIVNEDLRRAAIADIQLKRHEILCEQLPPGNPEFSYLKSELHRAEKIQRLRFSALQRLLNQKNHTKKSDSYGLCTHFGSYRIPEKRGEFYTHWKWVLCNPDRYGFSPKLPKKGIKKIKGEIFLSPEADRQLREAWNAEQDEKHTTNGGYYGGFCLTDEYCELIKKAEEKAGKYEPLRPSKFSFSPPTKQQVQPQFDDELPAPVDEKEIKSIRNRMDYLRRKQSKVQQ